MAEGRLLPSPPRSVWLPAWAQLAECAADARGAVMNNYKRFGLMILTSTIVMFGLMYLNTYELDHVFFSETRAYMAIVMGAVMALIMLAFMHGMYSNEKINWAIYIGSVVMFAFALWLVRSQATVTDVSYMRAMIPHH